MFDKRLYSDLRRYSAAQWAIRRPRLAIAFLVAVVLAATPGLLRLQIRTDGHALIPRNDRVVDIDAEIREHFGLQDPIVVLIETSHPDGIYNLDTLTGVQRLSDALAKLEGVAAEDIMSLATEHRDRVYRGTLNFRPYLDPLPETPELMETLRSDIAAARILTGTLLSADHRAVSLLVEVPEPPVSRVDFYHQVVELAQPFATDTDRVRVVGAPVAEALLGLHILQDLALLLPLALTVIALVILVGCRRLWGVYLAFFEVGACLVTTFGVMGWLGFPVYLTTAVLPVILTTIGLADEIHVFWHYQRILAARGQDSEKPMSAIEQTLALKQTMKEMTRPIVLTSVTTSLAFLSFLASPIDAVWSFGLFAAFGTLFCMVWSLTVIPACLALIPANKLRRPLGREPSRWWRRLLAPLLRHRFLTLAVLLLLSLGMGAGARRLYTQDSWVDGFAEKSDFYRSTQRANSLLHGTHTLLAHLTFDPPPEKIPRARDLVGPLLSRELIEKIGELESFIRDRPEVGGVLGIHTHLTTVAFLWQGRDEDKRHIPGDPYLVELLYDRFERGRGLHRRQEIVDDDMRRTVLTIFLEQANYRDTRVLMEAVRLQTEELLAEHGVQLDFAGDVAVSQAMIPAIVRTQVSSLLLALAGALLVLCFLYRSLRTGMLVLLPTCFAVLWIFGLMGWASIPLGVATSMFCAITLGIGVDYAIHLLERFRQNLEAGKSEPALCAAEEAGPAILTDVLAIALGFGLLVVSQVPANARLGLLVAAALVASALLTLVGLSALLNGQAERSA